MKAEIISKKELLKDGFFKVEEAIFNYEKFNGSMEGPVRRLCLERGDGVAAIVYNTSTSKAILVQQFRYPCYAHGDGWLIEVVAGMLGEGEEPEEAMKREVKEEIGYRVNIIHHISTFYVSPGGCSERIFCYCIEVDETCKIAEGGGLDHENEDIKLLEYSLAELREAIDNNRLADAKSIIACNYLLKKYGM